MFTSFGTSQLLERMPSIAYLDLPSANSRAQPLNPGNPLIVIDDYGLIAEVARKRVEYVNEQLGSIKIAALDLSTLAKSDDQERFRRLVQGRGPKHSVTLPNGRVKIMSYDGVVLCNVFPVDFDPIPYKLCRSRAISSSHSHSFVPLPIQTASEDGALTTITGNPVEDIAATKHTTFSDLPREIQAKIWQAAAEDCEGRVIVANEVRKCLQKSSALSLSKCFTLLLCPYFDLCPMLWDLSTKDFFSQVLAYFLYLVMFKRIVLTQS
jgi:hypothetical protein